MPSLRHAAHELLTAMDARVRVLLKGHRRALDRIVERLMADRHLDGDAAAALIRGTAPTASSEPSPLDQVRIRISMAQAAFIGPRPGAHS